MIYKQVKSDNIWRTVTTPPSILKSHWSNVSEPFIKDFTIISGEYSEKAQWSSRFAKVKRKMWRKEELPAFMALKREKQKQTLQ